MRHEKKYLCVNILSIWFIQTTIATADGIDFESGFVDTQLVATVLTPSNAVTFGTGNSSPDNPAFIAQSGDPLTAFTTQTDAGLPDDTPTGAGSTYSLTDQDGSNAGNAFSYFISFASPVLNLSLDLYDYRTPEGPVVVGDTATLTVFSDLFTSSVGSDVFTVVAGLPDGNIAPLSVSSPTSPILSASVTFSAADGGTAIDNILFTTMPSAIPEPTTFSLGMIGLLTLGFTARRRRRELF